MSAQETNFSDCVGAERCLISSIWREPERMDEVGPILVDGGAHFFDRRLSKFFTAISEYYEQAGKGYNLVELTEHLRSQDWWQSLGGNDAGVDIWDTVPHAADAAFYAKLIVEWSKVRRLAHVGEAIYQKAKSAAGPMLFADGMIEDAETLVFGVRDSTETTLQAVTVGTAAKEVIEKVQRNKELGHDPDRYFTGIPSLDAALTDYRPGSLITIAAGPSIGKSALAIGMAEHLAINGKPVLYISMEMTAHDISQRLLCNYSGVVRSRMDSGAIDAGDIESIEEAKKRLDPQRMYLLEGPGITIDSIHSLSRRAVRRAGVEMVVVDYLQLITYPSPSDETGSIRQLTGGLKRMAMDLRVPVLMLSQLRKKSSHERVDAEPTSEQLHGGGTIHKDSDVVMLIHRPEHHHKGDPDWEDQNPSLCGSAWVRVDKQRNGPTGRIRLGFDAARTKFYDLRDESEPGGM